MTTLGFIFIGAFLAALVAAFATSEPEKPKSDDEVFEDWIKVCEYRGMGYEFIQQARETHRQTKLLAARSRGTSSGGPQ